MASRSNQFYDVNAARGLISTCMLRAFMKGTSAFSKGGLILGSNKLVLRSRTICSALPAVPFIRYPRELTLLETRPHTDSRRRSSSVLPRVAQMEAPLAKELDGNPLITVNSGSWLHAFHLAQTLLKISVDFASLLVQDSPFPNFDRVQAEHVGPGIRGLLTQLSQEIDDLEQSVAATWQGLIDPLERISDRLSRAWGTISHLKAVKDNEALRKAYEEVISPCLQPDLLYAYACFIQCPACFLMHFISCLKGGSSGAVCLPLVSSWKA